MVTFVLLFSVVYAMASAVFVLCLFKGMENWERRKRIRRRLRDAAQAHRAKWDKV